MIWTSPGVPCDSMRLAVFTASPHRSYRNRLRPMTPATTGPELMPIRSCSPRSPTAPPGARGIDHVEAEVGQRAGVVRARVGHARRDHVRVADRLDLLEAVALGEIVEVAEQPVEQADDLGRRQAVGSRREVDDVGEQHRRRRELVGDRPRVEPSAAPRSSPAGC